jgi:hypothetical protein
LKTIHYNNGYASFQVPKEWVEEYEENGALVCYDEHSDDEFSLRLSIITVKPPADLINPSTENFMAVCGIPPYSEKYMIDTNNVIAIHRAKEEGEATNYQVYFYEYVQKNRMVISTWPSLPGALKKD